MSFPPQDRYARHEVTAPRAVGSSGRTGFVGIHWECRRLDDRCRLGRKALSGGGKSELRRAVCRITSGTDGSSHLDGKCNRERTASKLLSRASGSCKRL